MFVIVLFLACLSCRENGNKPEVMKKTSSISTSQNKLTKNLNEICLKNKDTILLKDFFIKIRKICNSDSTKIKNYLTKNVKSNYQLNFCSLLDDAYSNKEEEVSYKILEDSEDCKGIVEIYSVNFYKDEDGEEYRNEYSTYFYIIKRDNDLFIDKIGGAG